MAITFLCTGNSMIHAVWNGYLGAGGSVNHWQMGLASGKNTQLFGLNFQANKPDPALYMAGISMTLLYNKTWGITYQGEVGTAQPDISLSTISYDYTIPRVSTIAAQAQVLRTDHSLALSRVLGTSGLSLYVGFKLQAFGYRQNSGKYTEVETGTGNVTTERTFSIEQNIVNYGPAIGATYSFRIYRKVSGALQAGFIYFPGKYTADMEFSLAPGSFMNNKADENYYGLGATALGSVIIPFSEGILLQLSVRGQYYYARTRDGTVEVRTSTDTKQSSSATMNNVQDILMGAQAAIICKVF